MMSLPTPDPPTNLNVMGTTSFSVNFNWNPPSGGSDVVSYDIWWYN